MNNQSRSRVKIISYLFRFMLIFQIDRFCIQSYQGCAIRVKVGWPDDGSANYDREEEVQEIEWHPNDLDHLDDALAVSEYLIENGLVRNDFITVARSSLVERVCKSKNWSSDRSEAAIAGLLAIEVDMLDEGAKTDKFFVHF